MGNQIQRVQINYARTFRLAILDFKDLRNAEVSNTIVLSWEVIYFGILAGYLDKSSAILFAERNIENNTDVDRNIPILIDDESDVEETLFYLKKNFTILDSDKTNTLRKLRYIYLSEIYKEYSQNALTFSDFSNILTEFYDNHNYPEDMKTCVSYMSVEGSDGGGQEYLLRNFERFLNQETNWINKKGHNFY